MNRIAIGWRDMNKPSWLNEAERFAGRVLDTVGKDNWDLSMLFCSDEFIRGLNRDYRDKDEATDVLSFAMGDTIEEAGRPVFLAGDIVISVPALMRNSEEFGVEPDEELRRLIIHGVLHLSGRDHEDNNPVRSMLVEQEEILGKIKGEKIL